MRLRLRASTGRSSPRKRIGSYTEKPVRSSPPKSARLSKTSSSSSSSRSKNAKRSASYSTSQSSDQSLHVRLPQRLASSASASGSATPDTEASSSSDRKESDGDRPSFKALAVKHAKLHQTPWEYNNPAHRKIYGHPDDVKAAICEYRIDAVQRLGIQPGDRVLEIGCGHGYTTLSLAEAVGPKGFVMATDVADENYGSPLTIEQNQTCMISRAPSNLIDRFDFKMQTTVDELFRDHPEYENYFNKVVFAHSLFYFASTQEIRECFQSLWEHTPADAELCIAEWGMVESNQQATAHRAAVNCQAALEGYRKILKAPAINNVRTAATPGVLKELAQLEGWSNRSCNRNGYTGQVMEGFITPRKELPEGKWEVGMVMSERFWQDVKRTCVALPPHIISPAEAYYQISTQWDQIQLSIDDYGSDELEGVLSMDVWYVRLPKLATRPKSSPNDFMRHHATALD